MAARWLDAYLAADMTGEDLAAALAELRGQLPAPYRREAARILALEAEMQAALSGPSPARAGVEAAARRFLGVHPAEAVEVRGARGWTFEDEEGDR